MRKPHYFIAAIACFLLAAALLCLNVQPSHAQDTTLRNVLASDVTGVSFYYQGLLREVTDAETLDAVNSWTLTEVDVSGWYGAEGAPVSGYPLRRICLSLTPCTNWVAFYADDTNAAQVYAFLWLGEFSSRPHPDAIYAVARSDMDVLTTAFTESPFAGLTGTPREQFYQALDLRASGALE